jgi:hypothetical protein
VSRTRTTYRNAEIPGLIAELRPFLSTGKLPDGTRLWSAHSGPAVELGHLPARFHASARSAVYVVYSYSTPIAWAVEDDAGRGADHWFHVPDVGYSPTTGQHQYACLEAWEAHLRRQGDYRRGPGRHREVIRVPGNAEVYGRTLRARSGGVDGVRPGDVVGRRSAYEGVTGDAMHYTPGPHWSGRSHP